jgi:hypothetical protein
VKAHDLEEGDLLMIYKNRQGNFVSQQLLVIFYCCEMLGCEMLLFLLHCTFAHTRNLGTLIQFLLCDLSVL